MVKSEKDRYPSLKLSAGSVFSRNEMLLFFPEEKFKRIAQLGILGSRLLLEALTTRIFERKAQNAKRKTEGRKNACSARKLQQPTLGTTNF